MLDSTRRFSTRVDNYIQYRPRYPEAALELLREETGLKPDWKVADLGSGTGFSSELLLKHGNEVFGVEPNPDMRAAAEQLLIFEEKFASIDGTAEATTLPDASVDLIIAGQAFHWFDVPATRAECRRILKPEGWAALIWNERRVGDDALQAEYEFFLREFGTDYEQVGFQHKVDESSFDEFFGGPWTSRECFYEQRFDFEGLKGRVLSASYVPEPGAPRFDEMMAELRRLFEVNEMDGEVVFRYRTKVYCGRLA